MNTAPIEKIVDALLYEGYLLYPYRADSAKNQQRWNFGTLYPPAYAAANAGETAGFHSEFLVAAGGDTRLELRLRFLQYAKPGFSKVAENQPCDRSASWNYAVERSFDFGPLPFAALPQASPLELQFFREAEAVPGTPPWDRISGKLKLLAAPLPAGIFRVSLEVENTTALSPGAQREQALLRSLVSAHVIVAAEDGEFVSLLEPVSEWTEAAATCRNQGVFPVLAGNPGERRILLISPIILYDYPQIAPESAGDFFDGTEIDEMLTLRVLTLTDQEKEQMRRIDPRARSILERTSAIGEEQLLKIHGAVRGLRRAGEKP